MTVMGFERRDKMETMGLSPLFIWACFSNSLDPFKSRKIIRVKSKVVFKEEKSVV